MKKTSHALLNLVAALGLAAAPSHAATVFTETFEGWDGVTDLAGTFPDGTFTATTWGNLTSFTHSASTNLLRPSAGSAWLNPVAAELGSTFAMLHGGNTATADLADAFLDNTTYTLSFTHFRRDDLIGDAVTARIMTTGGSILATAPFAAVTTNDTYETRTFSFITNGGAEIGQNIRIQLFDPNGGTVFQQAGIDNIELDATPVPEPTRAVLLGIGGLALLLRRRR